MCGIFTIFGNHNYSKENIRHYFQKMQHRGPDDTELLFRDDFIIGFHRLNVINSESDSNQPICYKNWILVCNGEIYNHKELISQLHLPTTTHSDCEVILHLVDKYGPRFAFAQLDGVFACVLYNTESGTIVCARDPFGVRPLFMAYERDIKWFTSESKSIPHFVNQVQQFPPATFIQITNSEIVLMDRYFQFPSKNSNSLTHNYIYNYLENAVKKRLNNLGRDVGCLLSGGLDSSLIAALVYKFAPHPENVLFFSIGMSDSVDVIAAKKVIQYLNIAPENHHIVEFTPQQGFQKLNKVIYQLESYDITTIRASIPQYILSQYILEKTNVRILFSGEGADELFCGYQYSKLAPNEEELYNDSSNLLNELCYFDNLRTDRTTAGNSLEVRVPFLDKNLVSYVMSIDTKHRLCNNQMEKMLLRKSCEPYDLLPTEILYRHKEAFSDAVSSKKVSWYREMVKMIDQLVTEQEFLECKFTFNKPQTKEAYYYRKVFHMFFENRDKIIPHYWLPNWCSVTDPSATVLNCHVGDL